MKLTKDNFLEFTKSNHFVLVDFFATWCMPCRALGEELESLNGMEGLSIGKVDCDEERELVEQFGVMQIPLLLIYKDGVLIKKQVGYIPASVIKKELV